MEQVSMDLAHAPLVDRETVDMLREMDMVTDDDNLLLELVDEFLSHSALLMKEIVLHLEHENLPELASKTHSLKGASLNIGALALFTVCDRIEALARSEQLADTQTQLTLFNDAFSRTTVQLSAISERTKRGEDIEDLLD